MAATTAQTMTATRVASALTPLPVEADEPEVALLALITVDGFAVGVLVDADAMELLLQ